MLRRWHLVPRQSRLSMERAVNREKICVWAIAALIRADSAD
jgi:hypothetical protein